MIDALKNLPRPALIPEPKEKFLSIKPDEPRDEYGMPTDVPAEAHKYWRAIHAATPDARPTRILALCAYFAQAMPTTEPGPWMLEHKKAYFTFRKGQRVSDKTRANEWTLVRRMFRDDIVESSGQRPDVAAPAETAREPRLVLKCPDCNHVQRYGGDLDGFSAFRIYVHTHEAHQVAGYITEPTCPKCKSWSRRDIVACDGFVLHRCYKSTQWQDWKKAGFDPATRPACNWGNDITPLAFMEDGRLLDINEASPREVLRTCVHCKAIHHAFHAYDVMLSPDALPSSRRKRDDGLPTSGDALLSAQISRLFE